MSTPSASNKRPSSVRHTRAIQRDRRLHPTTEAPDELVQARLEELIHPATYAQLASYRALGLRERVLTLPVMVAFVLSLIWRHLGSVREAVRVLRLEGFLWVTPQQVSQQAVSERLRTFPAVLFERVLQEVLPQMQERALARTRPLPPVLAWTTPHFSRIVAVDGSTLDALLRKVGLLRGQEGPVLAGHLGVLFDVVTRVPQAVWYEEDSQASDHRFWDRIHASVKPGMLVLCDLGFRQHAQFTALAQRGVGLLTRVASNAALAPIRSLSNEPSLRDHLVWLGRGKTRCPMPVRLVEWRHPQGNWYRYLTTITDPQILPAAYVVALYGERWRIEEAFQTVKRLLGLAYFWVGSINGVQVQVWATWLLYTVLVDLTDAVAEELGSPLAAVSLELVYRGLSHFTHAFHRSEANDPVRYLADNAKALDLVKQPRKNRQSLSDLLHLTDP